MCQRCTRIHLSHKVFIGKNYTLFSTAIGIVRFKKHVGKTVAPIFPN